MHPADEINLRFTAVIRHQKEIVRMEAERIDRNLQKAIEGKLISVGRILPGEEVWRDRWVNGGTVVYTMPEVK